ncbi:MAG: hypothetical protein GX784_00880 [Firmicutes bacterium]|nr:hypothetical protein [Candidatus Fermentithermobacillaceae bacterium]
MNITYMALLVAALIIMFLYEVPAMVRQNHRRDLAVFSVLSLFVFALCLITLMDVNVPSFLEAMGAVLDAFLGLLGRP